jgi:hypothetical protein
VRGIILFSPPILLLVFGMAVGMMSDSSSDTLSSLSGLCVGYLVPSIIGTMIFRGSIEADASTMDYGLALFDTVIFMGFVYPLVFGGTGLLLMSIVSRSGSTRNEDIGLVVFSTVAALISSLAFIAITVLASFRAYNRWI